ncbi:hypothetical protein MASR2M78_25850 [Treponema sp.]
MVDQKDLLLREVHHRMKNNLNSLHSLFELDASTRQDPKASALLKDAQMRLLSMGVLYDELFRTRNIQALSVRDYLPSLMNQIKDTFKTDALVSMDFVLEDLVLEVKIISVMGIIANEITTNIMKYAFVDRERGHISVSLAKKEGRVCFSIEDNGVGFPIGTDLPCATEKEREGSSSGFGLHLISLLAAQLRGTARMERTEGTKLVVEFSP